MRRCTHCARFHPGHPTFCSGCGRSFGVRLCARGHPNARTATYCTACGSADLSTPAPPESLLMRLLGPLLTGAVWLIALAVVLGLALALLVSLADPRLADPFVALLVLVGLLWWVLTLVPAPVKKVGKAVAHGLGKALGGRARRGH